MPVLKTAQQILNAANAELGLPAATFNGPPGDQTGRQASAMIQAIGDDLCRVHDWQFLEKQHEFTATGAEDHYSLPDDFGRIVNQTFWASSDSDQVRGPVSSQTWGWLKYGLMGTDGTPYRYRILNNLMRVHPRPPADTEFVFYYIKKNWVLTYITAVEKATVDLAGDQPMFDGRLMVSALKVRLWGQKGFDTTQVQQEFNFVLASEKSISQGAPVIDLTGGRQSYLISSGNLPEGNWNV